MNIESVLPLVAAAAYTPLLIILIVHRKWHKRQALLAAYLGVAMMWSMATFLLRSDYLLHHKVLLYKIVLCALPLSAVQLYYFIMYYHRQSGGKGVIFGYGLLGLLVVLTIAGVVPQSFTVTNGMVQPVFTWVFYAILLMFFSLPVYLLYYLQKRIRTISDPGSRNTTVYLLVSMVLIVIGVFAGLTPLGARFPVTHFVNLFNACILTYAMVRSELLSFTFVARRIVTWTALIVVGVVVYLTLYGIVHFVFGFTPQTFALVSATGGAIAVGVILILLRDTIMLKVDRLLRYHSYDYREELATFVRKGLGGIFSLREFSQGLLPPLVRAMDCQHACILLPETASGDFVIAFQEPPALEQTSALRIKKESPIVKWLLAQKRYLTRDALAVTPCFEALWDEEREGLTRCGIEVIFPFISRDNLVGILALTAKRSGRYVLEDVSYVEGITSQAAMTLEKEYLQEELRKSEQELALINRLASVMTSSLNIDEVYDTFVAGLGGVLDVEVAAVALIEGTRAYCPAFYSREEGGKLFTDHVPLKGTATEWVVRHKRSVYEPDLAYDAIFMESQELFKRGIRSAVFLPLISKGDGIGSLTIASKRPGVYTPAQVNLLERLAFQISTSVANAQLYSKAERRARVDELTGLFNRRHFNESLALELSRHSRYGSMLSLLFIDLDNFKGYNDSNGHSCGDKLLSHIGRLIKESLRNIDMAFRYGGDEFAIIMPHTSGDDASVVAERLRKTVNGEMRLQRADITLSLGLASWPSDGLTASDLIDAADKALYYAKRTGGNRTCKVAQTFPSLQEQDTSAVEEQETLNTIYALASTIETRDPYTYGHSRKVRTYAVALAEALNLPPDKVALIGHAALLHDIGKIGIYDEVLNKAGKLNVHEMDLVKTHPELSKAIVAHVPSLALCLPAILHHHEKWDGSGYPGGLKGEAIPMEARILAIADAFDAMTSLRPYRAPLSYREAVEELKCCAGTQFDPWIVEAFLPVALTVTPEDMANGALPHPIERPTD